MSDIATVTIPALQLRAAIVATEHHRMKAGMRIAGMEGLFVAVDTTGHGRVIFGATDRYTLALATTAAIPGDYPDTPPPAADAIRDLAVQPGVFADPATGGTFEAGRKPAADIDRLSLRSADTVIVVTVKPEHISLAGDGGTLHWPRIDASNAPDLPAIFNKVTELKDAAVPPHNLAYQPALLRRVAASRVAGDSVRLTSTRPNGPVIVTTRRPLVPCVQLIMPVGER